MPQLFKISFTTKTIVTKVVKSNRGKKIETVQVPMSDPIVMTALPYSTAMAYSKCDNFKIEPYEISSRNVSTADRPTGVGNGFKRKTYTSGAGETASKPASKSKTAPESRQKSAAQTGDLGESFNV